MTPHRPPPRSRLLISALILAPLTLRAHSFVNNGIARRPGLSSRHGPRPLPIPSPLRPADKLVASSCGPSAREKSMSTMKSISSEEYPASGRALGLLVLLTVPLAWGTYAPVVKYVYELNPPVPGLVFSSAYYLVASISLLTLITLKGDNESENFLGDASTKSDVEEPTTTSLPMQGGLELGSYLFLGNCLQVVGLETVPADRAAFLVQLTTIMVPLFQAALARDLMAISMRTWVACGLAFGGVVVMGLDGNDMGMGDDSFVIPPLSALTNTFAGGDLLIIMSAVAYTMHVIRLGRYAQSTTPLRLAAAKATTEAVLSLGLIWALFSIGNGALGNVPAFLDKLGGEITSFFSYYGHSASFLGTEQSGTLLPAAGACLWTGWVTCAYTIYAQSFGQRRVSPADANLVYTTQPLFSALFAWALLGETLGSAGFAGAGLIGAALWLITSSDANDDIDVQVDSQTNLLSENDEKDGSIKESQVEMIDEDSLVS